MRKSNWLFTGLLAGCVTSCSSTSDPGGETAENGDVGQLQVNLTNVPADAACLQVSVTGPRPLTQLIDITPGTPASYTIGRLPLGIITVSGQAYTAICNAITGSTVAQYVVDAPVSVRVDAVDVNTITLNLIRNGRIGVEVNFEGGPVPYLVPVAASIAIKPLLTVGDSVNKKPDGVTPYRMVGIPDGLGAEDNGDGTFNLYMNHEISSGGVVRAHGANGAFVSKWKIRKSDLTVLNGSDLIQQVVKFDAATASYLPPASGNVFSRFCSADLAPVSSFYDSASGLGFNGRLFFNGEEVSGGKAWAHGTNGTSFELPRLGKQSWENTLANPGTGTKTVVVGTDDSSPRGQVYVYVGSKTNTGNAVQMAGLTNGSLYGVAVTGFIDEVNATGIPSGTPFTLAPLGNVETLTSAQIETASDAGGATRFLRPEDGAWDPAHLADFYFVTTNGFNQPTRLWRLHFSDINNIPAGGTIDMLLDGTEGAQMFDNITLDTKGHVYLQEDVGNNAWLGQIWRYTIATDQLTLIAKANPSLFLSGASGFLTQDEEASGIIDAKDLIGPGWFLLDMQAHYNPGDPELVEGGQLLALFDPAAL